jgi:phage terminase small subunit
VTDRRTGKAPGHLRPTTRRWWEGVVAAYELEEHHVRVLTVAAESWDRMTVAREVLDREGLTYTDRFGAPRPRPELGVERDSKVLFLRAVRELALDTEGPTEPWSRPPGIKR